MVSLLKLAEITEVTCTSTILMLANYNTPPMTIPPPPHDRKVFASSPPMMTV